MHLITLPPHSAICNKPASSIQVHKTVALSIGTVADAPPPELPHLPNPRSSVHVSVTLSFIYFLTTLIWSITKSVGFGAAPNLQSSLQVVSYGHAAICPAVLLIFKLCGCMYVCARVYINLYTYKWIYMNIYGFIFLCLAFSAWHYNSEIYPYFLNRMLYSRKS